MKKLSDRLKKRGWKKSEISKAVRAIQNAKKNKTSEALFLEKRIYWILLAIIITANFAISVALIPVLMALKGWFLYVVVATLGIVFGLLFELVIRSIEHFKRKHHIALVVLIPLISFVNIVIISKTSASLITALNIINTINQLLVALVYAGAFVLPFLVYKFVLKIEYYSEN